MDIQITPIPHSSQRYNTIGDWQFDSNRNLRVVVSKMGNVDFEFLVGLHEVIEAFLCRRAGITTKQVDAFDMSWVGKGEPGDDVRAPYYRQHMIATMIENIIGHELDIDWEEYDTILNLWTQNYAPPPASPDQGGPHKPTKEEFQDMFRMEGQCDASH